MFLIYRVSPEDPARLSFKRMQAAATSPILDLNFVQHTFIKACLPLMLGLILSLAFSPKTWAQNASVTGTVTDASGGVVVGASVSTKNMETGAERAATSNDTGAYRIVDLQPGTYEIAVDKQGFRTVHFKDIVLTVSQVLPLDVKLEVAAVAPTIELDNASISNTVDQISRL